MKSVSSQELIVTDRLKTEVGASILNNSLPLIWTDTFFLPGKIGREEIPLASSVELWGKEEKFYDFLI